MGFSLVVQQIKSHQHSSAVGDGGTLTSNTILNGIFLEKRFVIAWVF
jgi:hypothetical protein